MIMDRFPLHEEEDQILFPSYHEAGYFDRIVDIPNLLPNGDLSTALPALKGISECSLPTESTTTAVDDTAIRKEPHAHVDYLSHDWTEEDLSSSWRSIVSKQAVHSNSQRLENASWRAWMKAKYGLKTVAPETLDWRKDSDITWLYGPLHKSPSYIQARPSSPSESQVSTPASYQIQRPILKKRTLAETLLQRSFSAYSISQQSPCTPQTPKGNATSFVSLNAMLGSPRQPSSTFSIDSTLSGTHSPATAERRRIQFNNNVSQCIALDSTHEPEEVKLSCAIYEEEEDDDSSEDDGSTLTLSTSSLLSRTSIPHSHSSKTIAFLPSTTLKTHEGSSPQRPSLSRGTPFRKPDPETLPLTFPLPPPPSAVLTPSKYFFRDIDEGGVKLGVSWQTDSISAYENTSYGTVGSAETLASPLRPYEAFKVQTQGYGACLHYDEDEHALLMELGCI